MVWDTVLRTSIAASAARDGDTHSSSTLIRSHQAHMGISVPASDIARMWAVTSLSYTVGSLTW
jgi:hypothetical protein